MLTNNELDNMVLHNQLNKQYPHKVNIQYGLDINKVKGIDKFPIYNESKEFISQAKTNADSFMFHSNDNKYNIGKSTHHSIDNIEPYYYNKNSKSSKLSYGENNEGLMSRLYGLPPDRNIIIENPTAQAMNFMGGQITEEKLTVHNWGKKEGGEVDSFMKDPRVDSIVNGTTPNTGGVSNVPTEEENKENKKFEIPKPRAKTDVIVEPAFPTDKPKDEFKTPHKEEVKTQQPTAEKKDPKKYESVETVENLLKKSIDNDPKGKSVEEQQKIVDILKRKGYINLPHANIKINSTFANKVRKIIAGTETELTPNEQRIFKKLISSKRKDKVVKKLTEEMGFEKEG